MKLHRARIFNFSRRANRTPMMHTYTQVFEGKHGFIPNLSILDLLFNEGTNALTYLEQQTLT